MKFNPAQLKKLRQATHKHLKDKDDDTLVELIETMLPIVSIRKVRRAMLKNIPPAIQKSKDGQATKERYLGNERLIKLLKEIGLSKEWLERL